MLPVASQPPAVLSPEKVGRQPGQSRGTFPAGGRSGKDRSDDAHFGSRGILTDVEGVEPDPGALSRQRRALDESLGREDKGPAPRYLEGRNTSQVLRAHQNR